MITSIEYSKAVTFNGQWKIPMQTVLGDIIGIFLLVKKI